MKRCACGDDWVCDVKRFFNELYMDEVNEGVGAIMNIIKDIKDENDA